MILSLAESATRNIETIAKLASAMSPLISVLAIVFALHVWRVQLVAKRRFEVAEEALTISRTIVYALSSIRNVAGFSSEGATRKASEGEAAEQTERLNNAYVPFERAERYNDQFASLGKSIIISEIHLGKEMSGAMQVLMSARARIFVAASGLRRLNDPKLELTPDRQKRISRYEAVIWETRDYDTDSADDEDVLSQEIDNAIDRIERLCRKFLTPPRFRDAFRLVGPRIEFARPDPRASIPLQ